MSFTQIQNHFIDTEMKNLSASAVCVYLCICRQTTGWHKNEDSISLSQFMSMTGMSKPTIIKALKELTSRGTIAIQSGRTLSVSSTITLSKSVCCESSSKNISPASQKTLPEVVKKIDTQKKEKQTKQKKSVAQRDERLSQWQFTVYRELTHLHVPFAYRDEVAQLQNESVWREVIVKWIGRGYRPNGIAGMLEWYRKEMITHGRHSRQSVGGSGSNIEKYIEANQHFIDGV